MRSHGKTVFEVLGRQPIHPFPARMAAGIALDALAESSTPLRVLDPMAGSGTVLALARAKGHEAIGIDLDPLAVLLSKVWTTTVDRERVKGKAEGVLMRARSIFARATSAAAYPKGSDAETREFIRYWFDDYARRQLYALSTAIGTVRDKDERDVLWCAFSRLIIAKSVGASLAMDLAHSRPHKKFNRAPAKPFNRFLLAVKTVVGNCIERHSDDVGPSTSVRLGDARKLDVESGSIDLILTSPPYLNAIDYMRCSKFSLVWMGYTVGELRRIRSASVGTEASTEEAAACNWTLATIEKLKLRPALSNRHHALLAQYVWDMGRALQEASRVLRIGGRAVYVVGDSTIRGTFVRNSLIVAALAKQNELRIRCRYSRSLPANRRYMPPPKGRSQETMNGRMRREVVLVFEKCEA